MLAYNAGTFAVLTAGPRAFVIHDRQSKRIRAVTGEAALALALDLINRPASKRLPDATAEVYLEGFFKGGRH